MRELTPVRRNLIYGAVGLSVFFTVFFGLAWINNLFLALKWYSEVAKGDIFLRPEVRDGALADLSVLRGPLPFLDWMCVDLSTVTTFIPFFGFLLVSLGFRKVFRKRPITDYFPFFKSYERLIIALGLVGTLWGIIMIGYYPQDAIRMSNLVTCLHTALFSTMIAVIWVFIVAAPISALARWCHVTVVGDAEEDHDLVDLLERLRHASFEAKTGFEDVSGGLEGFKRRLDETGTELDEALKSLNVFRERTGAEMFEAVETACRGMNDVFAETRAESKSLAKVVESLGRSVSEMSAVMTEQRAFLEKLEKRLQSAERRKDAAEKKIQEVVSDRAAARGKNSELEKRCCDAESQLSKIKSTLK